MHRSLLGALVGLLVVAGPGAAPARATALPDLVVSGITAPTMKNAGQLLAVSSTVKNQGTAKAGVSKVRTFLSTDTVAGSGDFVLGTRDVTALAVGGTATGTTSWTLPTTIRKGTWNIIVCADRTLLVKESNESNNCRVKAFTINKPPVATDDTLSATEDTSKSIAASTLLANDSDPEGRTLTVSGVANAQGGQVSLSSGTVTFKPEANRTAPASFTYTVKDNLGLPDTALVTVNITAVNDKPVAVDDVLGSSPEDQAVVVQASTLLANDTDVDGDTRSVVGVANVGGHGTVARSGTNITFTPTANYNGPAWFDYTVGDGHGGQDVGRASMTITAVPDSPSAGPDDVVTLEDTTLQVSVGNLMANDADPDGGTLSVTGVSGPVGGIVSLTNGIVTFTPSADRDVDGSFQYTLSDGDHTALGTVTVDITPVNDAPVAVDDGIDGVAEDTVVHLTTADLVANDVDVDGPSTSVTAVSGAVGGSVQLVDGGVTFTPTTNRTEASSFSYTVSDGSATDTGVVTITWTPVNDPPIAVDDQAATRYQAQIVIPKATLTANDIDVDGDLLTLTQVSGALHGSASINGDNVLFTPEGGYSGEAGFDYTLSDGVFTDVGHVTITVADPIVIQTSVASQTVTEGSSASVGVRLAAQPSQNVTVFVASSDTGAMTAGPSTLTFTPANYATYQDITVNGAQDVDLVAESVTLSLTATGAITKQVGVTVNDDDTQAIVVDQTTVYVDEGASTLLKVHLAFQPTSNVTVTVASSDPGAASVSPSLLTFTPANFALDQSVTVSGVEDFDYLNETGTITLSSASAPTKTPAFYVFDNDDPCPNC